MKKCQAKASSTGKKCRLWPKEGSVYCRIHDHLLYPVLDKYLSEEMVLYPSLNGEIVMQEIVIPQDIWTLILDEIGILDIRMFRMTCRYMRAFSRSYLNSLKYNLDRQRYCAFASKSDGAIIEGDVDTPFYFTRGIVFKTKGQYWNNLAPMSCVVHNYKRDVDNEWEMMGWKSEVILNPKNVSNLFFCIDNYKSYIALCRKLRDEEDDDILSVEVKGYNPLSLLKLVEEFSSDLACHQAYIGMLKYHKTPVQIEIEGRKVLIENNKQILREARDKIRKASPSMEILIVDDKTVMTMEELAYI